MNMLLHILISGWLWQHHQISFCHPAASTVQPCINGDFDGDKKPDTLCASLISRINNQPLSIDTTLETAMLIARTIRQKPLLQLASNGFTTITLNEGNDYVLGLYYLSNIGNINQFPGDEIALVINAADWSNINLCKVYSYRDKQWRLFKETEIREDELPDIRSGRVKPWKH